MFSQGCEEESRAQMATMSKTFDQLADSATSMCTQGNSKRREVKLQRKYAQLAFLADSINLKLVFKNNIESLQVVVARMN